MSRLLSLIELFAQVSLIVTLAAVGLFAQGQKANTPEAPADGCVLIIDASRSVRDFADQIKEEATTVTRSYTDDTWCSLVVVTLTTTTRFAGKLTNENRERLQTVLEETEFTGWNSALGEALHDATEKLKTFPGRKTVSFFTDGVNRPGTGSPYRWKTFQELLEDLDPQLDIRWQIRLFDGAALEVTNPAVRIVRSPDGWEPTREDQPPPAITPPPPRRAQLELWYVIGISLTVVAIIVVLLIVRQMRQISRAELERATQAALRLPVRRPPPPMENLPIEEEIVIPGVQIFEEVSGEQGWFDENESVILGEEWGATFPLKGVGGSVRLSLRGTKILVENIGARAVFVGAVSVQTGKPLMIERDYYELLIGRQVFYLVPENRTKNVVREITPLKEVTNV